MMRAGITGGAGFIGGHVVKALQARGIEPVVFDHMGRGLMLGDVRDRTAVFELAAHVDGIIHLAAVLGTQETIRDPRPAAETNILGGLNVLEACENYNIPVVNIAVGNWWMRNTYSTTKHTVERLLEQYRDNLNLRAVNVRAVNAYGPGQSSAAPFGSAKVRKIIPSFVCRALSGEPIEVYGDGQQVSDMVYVTDVADTLVSALVTAESGEVPGHVIEVGPTEHNTVLSVAELVRDLVGHGEIRHLPMRPGEEVGATVTANNETLAAVGIDRTFLTPLRLGLAETIEWFKQNRGVTWR
jgi:UDP-glucose 4-epimerase